VTALVLASASPRRREILTTLGIAFEVRPSDVDETLREGERPVEHACRLAKEKALAVAETCTRGEHVLAADTIVVLGEEVLGKPDDDAHARGMLQKLAGRWHEVTTGVAVCRAGEADARVVSVTTRVKMRALDAAAIDRYVATGEGRDKAGAYAVQGIASGIVAAIEGSFSNVVGLPAAETVELLQREGAIGAWP
jgi:septum formation protein